MKWWEGPKVGITDFGSFQKPGKLAGSCGLCSPLEAQAPAWQILTDHYVSTEVLLREREREMDSKPFSRRNWTPQDGTQKKENWPQTGQNKSLGPFGKANTCFGLLFGQSAGRQSSFLAIDSLAVPRFLIRFLGV